MKQPYYEMNMLIPCNGLSSRKLTAEEMLEVLENRHDELAEFWLRIEDNGIHGDGLWVSIHISPSKDDAIVSFKIDEIKAVTETFNTIAKLREKPNDRY